MRGHVVRLRTDNAARARDDRRGHEPRDTVQAQLVIAGHQLAEEHIVGILCPNRRSQVPCLRSPALVVAPSAADDVLP